MEFAREGNRSRFRSTAKSDMELVHRKIGGSKGKARQIRLWYGLQEKCPKLKCMVKCLFGFFESPINYPRD